MNLQSNLSQISTKQALGYFLLVLTIFSYMGGLAWISAYWDHNLIEEYRGYEIYFFPEINVYGIAITELDITDWSFNTGMPGCRNMIDTWLDDPIHISDYRDYVIYQQPNDYGFYYAVDPETGEQITTTWNNLEDLQDYIDQVYYPYVVLTKHRDFGDYVIYRQGQNAELRYWVESPDGGLSQLYSTFDDANDAADEIIRLDMQVDGSNLDNGSETDGGTIEPSVGSQIEDGYEVPENIDTIGDRLRQRSILISSVFGVLGVGFIAIDAGERRR